MPTRNTASNSRPLAECSVISVTAPEVWFRLSTSVISATFSRKSVSVPSGFSFANSETAPSSSRMFSMRVWFSSVLLSSSALT